MTLSLPQSGKEIKDLQIRGTIMYPLYVQLFLFLLFYLLYKMDAFSCCGLEKSGERRGRIKYICGFNCGKKVQKVPMAGSGPSRVERPAFMDKKFNKAATQSFSELKKNQRNKILVTYDIFENRAYCFLLALMDFMFTKQEKKTTREMMVLPMQTPPEKFDEIQKRLRQYTMKKK